MKWKLLVFFVFLLFLPIVTAAPPFLQSGTGEFELEIAFPKFNYLKFGQDIDLHFHVFNASGHFMRNDTTDCLIHIYDNTGAHIVEQDKLVHDPPLDWSFVLNTSIITEPGSFAYIVQCNTSAQGGQGGFSSNSFEVTVDGVSTDNVSPSTIAITMFILVVTFTLFILPFIKSDFVGAEKDPTRADRFAKQMVNLILKRSCWTIATYLMMLNSAIMATLAQTSNLPILNEMFRYMWLFGIAGWMMIFFLMFSTVIQLTKLWRKNLEAKRMGDVFP